MRYFVTLFDSNYLTRGLAMYRSLLRHSKSFHLWIICFDQTAFDILSRLELPHISPVSLQQFEDEKLLKIKSERSPVEYFWTCTPSTCLYVLQNEPHVDMITYLDADLMFFSNPEPIFTEMADSSILLTEHRYLEEFDKSISNGIFNVQFMTFVRNKEGLLALSWWRDRCLEWCYAKSEDNKFGDQKYLDSFPEMFQNVHILKHLGAGLAPWNSDRYKITEKSHQIFVDNYPLIFYHFHALQIYQLNIGYVCPQYPISNSVRRLIYKKYCTEISIIYKDMRELYPKFNLGIINLFKILKTAKKSPGALKQILLEIFQGRYIIYE
jgi:hypothetical protein